MADKTLKVGSKVKCSATKDVNGVHLAAAVRKNTYTVSKINGNKIYLPYSGYKTYSNTKDSDLGYYWTSNINISFPMNAKIWLLTKSGSDTSLMHSRACGLTVRPVISK